MQNDLTTTPQATTDGTAATIEALAARVATLERHAVTGRRWRFAFAALAVVMVSMGAAYSVNDAEFGTVKAKAFEVIGSEGVAIGSFTSRKNEESGVDQSFLVVTGERKKKATFVEAGAAPNFVDRTGK